jgi:pilus assembly protein CpaC
MVGWRRRISPWILAGSVVLGTARSPLLYAEDAPAPGAAPATPLSTAANPLDANPEDDRFRTLAVGQIDTIELDFTPSPSINYGNKDVIAVEPGSNPREFRVNMKKKGTSDLVFYYENGKVGKKFTYNVVTNDLSGKVNNIRRLLQDIEGIYVYSMEDKIVIDGELVVPRDLDRILQVQDAYKDTIFNLVTLSKVSREALARRMQKEINDDPGGVNVQVRIMNDTFFLSGKVDSAADRDRAEMIAQTYLPELMGSPALKENALTAGFKKVAIKNLIQIEEPPPAPTPKMVRITYHFVEIGKEYLKSSFFKWVPFLTEGAGITIGQSTTGGTAATSNGSFQGTISNLIPKLQSGASGGFVRVLFSTVQMAEDKTQVELVRQDNIPFVGAVVNGVPVPENASAGVNVKCQPEILSDNRVRMATYLNFTAVTGNGAGGKPGTTSTTMQNQLIVKSGDSAALGGLISSNTAKDIDKDPEQATNQGGNPIFTLLRSKSFRNNRSQFVVFITPKIVEDAAEGTADIKAKILNNSSKKRRRVVQ